MATGQTILNLMEVLHPEMQLQVGENDVNKGLLAANMAQDYMETVFALHPDLLGDGTGTVVTANGVETTTFPSTLLRLDRVQYLDPSTSKPLYDLRDIRRTGGQVMTTGYPLVNAANTVGGPEGYWTDGTNFYWTPIPDGTYTLRWYGFVPQADITASGTFGYRDVCLTPLAALAVRFIRVGLDDDPQAYIALAKEIFEPVVKLLSNFQRESAPGYMYRYRHTT